MSPTKVLTINPVFFTSKQNNSKTMKKERKQKPNEIKTTNSMRKALLAKIRDYQQKEGEKIKEKNKEQIEEKDPSFESEFNKSLNFLQEISNKHKDKKKQKQMNKTFKRPMDRNQNEQFINIDLPETLIDIPPIIHERNSHLNNRQVTDNIVQNHINTTLSSVNYENSIEPMSSIQTTSLDETISFKPLIKNTQQTIPQNTNQSIEQDVTQLSTHDIHPNIQTKPLIPDESININTIPLEQNIVTEENIKLKIKDIDTGTQLIEKMKSNIKQSKQRQNTLSFNVNNHTIKSSPLYSNLKGGTRPTYRELNKTHKNYNTLHPKITIDENKNMKMTIPSKKLITRKTKTIKYNLGKRGKNINILIKNNNTRKKIKQELMSLRKKPILEVKEYLHDKNLIKTGTLAPNDVLREIYEQSILSGDLINNNRNNLIHNFLNTKPYAF